MLLNISSTPLITPPFHAPGVKVSGTNINFGANAWFTQMPAGGTPTEPAWDQAWVKHWKLKMTGTVGGAASATTLVDATPAGFQEGYAKTVRFASTHFDHGSDVVIRLEATFGLSIGPPGQGGQQGEHTMAPLEVTISAYNRGLFLATQETFASGSYSIDLTGIAATLARECIAEAIPRVQGMQHIVEPATATEAQNQRQVDLDAKFKRNTVFVAVTHGSPDGIRASHTDEMPWDPLSNPTSITAMVQTGRDVPLYNLVLLIACSTAYNGAWDRISKPFGIRHVNPGPPSIDRCVVAFTTEVGTERNKDNLPLWTAKFFEYVAAGYTAKEAIDEVHGQNIFIYPPPMGASAVKPVVVGDIYTKLIGYYVGSESDEVISTWFQVR